MSQSTVSMLKALANGNRLSLLKEIHQKKSLTVGEAATFLSVTDSAASKHLKLLEEAGLLMSTKRGLFLAFRWKVAGVSGWVKQMMREM